MKKPEFIHTSCPKVFPIRSLLVLFILLSMESGRTLKATVEGGASLSGTTFSDNNSTVANSSKAIKWSSSNLDQGTFDYNASAPTRIKVKTNGDYFFAFTGPLEENSRISSNRSQVEFVLRKNGVAIPEGSTRSTYLRHESGHIRSSGHFHLLVPNLSANDYIEIFAKNIDTHANSVKIGTCSLYCEKVSASRTVFSATTTGTVAGNDFNPASDSALQWDNDLADSGFTHSDSVNSHNITLDSAGKYLVFVNLPPVSYTHLRAHET